MSKLGKLLKRRLYKLPLWVIVILAISAASSPYIVRAVVNFFSASTTSNLTTGVNLLGTNCGGQFPGGCLLTNGLCTNGSGQYQSAINNINWGNLPLGSSAQQYFCINNNGTGNDILQMSGGPPNGDATSFTMSLASTTGQATTNCSTSQCILNAGQFTMVIIVWAIPAGPTLPPGCSILPCTVTFTFNIT